MNLELRCSLLFESDAIVGTEGQCKTQTANWIIWTWGKIQTANQLLKMQPVDLFKTLNDWSLGEQ